MNSTEHPLTQMKGHQTLATAQATFPLGRTGVRPTRGRRRAAQPRQASVQPSRAIGHVAQPASERSCRPSSGHDAGQAATKVEAWRPQFSSQVARHRETRVPIPDVERPAKTR